MSNLLDAAGRPMPKQGGTYVILFDIDGTLADHAHRAQHLNRETPDGKPDWDLYFDGCDKDEPINAGAVIFNLLATQCRQLGHLIQNQKIDADIPYVDCMTGRPERLRAKTLEWFTSSGLLMPRALHMRPDGDHSPDNELKIRMYEQIYKDKETVLAVFEDRERCVKAWRAAGIPCYQVAEGAF